MATKHKQSDEQQLSLFDEETDLASNLSDEADDDWLQDEI